MGWIFEQCKESSGCIATQKWSTKFLGTIAWIPALPEPKKGFRMKRGLADVAAQKKDVAIEN
jgi:hypothetical protein